MAYVPPTAEDFVARFPEFDGQDDVIALVLPEAERSADGTWNDTDRKNAVMYFAAHLISMGESIGAGGAAIASESLGPISVSYSKGSQNSSVLMSTSYGVQYRDLLKRNRGGPVVI